MTTEKKPNTIVLPQDMGAPGEASRKRGLEIRETMTAGITQMAVKEPLLIDRALRTGVFGPSNTDKAKWRYEAAKWLRDTYELAGLVPKQSGSYQTRSEAEHEISDGQAWNQGALFDAAKAIGTDHYNLLLSFVVGEINVRATDTLIYGLDRLAFHRGIMPKGAEWNALRGTTNIPCA